VERLIRAFVQVDDRQPSKRQPDPIVVPNAFAVRASTCHRVGHPAECRGVDGSTRDDACDPTHAAELCIGGNGEDA
jgi:hypothetical protein